MRFAYIALVFAILSAAYLRADELPRRIIDGSGSDNAAEPYLGEALKKFVAHFKEPKEHAFIARSEGAPSLKWHASQIIVITQEMAAVHLDEGHVRVTGLYVRNNKDGSWDLKVEEGGIFRDRQLFDLKEVNMPEAKAKPEQ